jgi:hypothetical protein
LVAEHHASAEEPLQRMLVGNISGDPSPKTGAQDDISIEDASQDASSGDHL